MENTGSTPSRTLELSGLLLLDSFGRFGRFGRFLDLWISLDVLDPLGHLDSFGHLDCPSTVSFF